MVIMRLLIKKTNGDMYRVSFTDHPDCGGYDTTYAPNQTFSGNSPILLIIKDIINSSFMRRTILECPDIYEKYK